MVFAEANWAVVQIGDRDEIFALERIPHPADRAAFETAGAQVLLQQATYLRGVEPGLWEGVVALTLYTEEDQARHALHWNATIRQDHFVMARLHLAHIETLNTVEKYYPSDWDTTFDGFGQIESDSGMSEPTDTVPAV